LIFVISGFDRRGAIQEFYEAMKIIRTFFIGLACAIAPQLLAQQPAPLSVLHTFTGAPDGRNPLRPLVVGAIDNFIYGCTPGGGTNDFGTIFRIGRDGSGHSVIHNFSQGDQDLPGNVFLPGLYVTRGADDVLYGTSMGGTNFGSGMVFKLNTDGSGYTILHSFTNSDFGPLNLMQGRDGFLYGAGFNAVFKLDTNGGNYSALHIFTNATDGMRGYGRLLQSSDGALYGTTYLGGTNNDGAIFKINTNGAGFAILHTFTGNPDGRSAYAGLTEGSDGALYGVTRQGGTNDAGIVFKLNQDGSGYQILHHFKTNGVDAAFPAGDLVLGLNNLLYGTTQLGGTNGTGAIFEIGLDGNNYAVLHHLFNGIVISGGVTNYVNEGSSSYAGLVRGPASDGSGVLYGVTQSGGYLGTLFGIVVNPPLSITPIVGASGGKPVVFWPAWALSYRLQTTTNLADTNSWTAATNGIPVTGFQPTNAAPGAYYRLVLPQ
jgi:uncharacterized repeat protein (TIGR03803 family)